MQYFDDTITAIATPPGTGAIAVIRVSGRDAFFITDKIFHGKTPISEAKSHTLHYGKIVDSDGNTIDDVVVSVFKAPHSYTGENSTEISTHGNQLITAKVVSRLLEVGARLAEPGEFTKRAFLNNRLDLSQAEAVAAVINARSEASLRGARNQLDGMLSAKIGFLRSELINTSSLIELELDFAEEDLEFVQRQELIKKISGIIEELQLLIRSYRFGKVVSEGVNVAITGLPNVGKSSLLNYLLKEARAIVSNIPGTTRDVIREELTIDGVLIKISDTAGIRSTEDVIEMEGVNRSREVIHNADFVILLHEVERDLPEELLAELSHLSENDRIIKVLNKSDKSPSSVREGWINISVKEGWGIDNLLRLIKDRAMQGFAYSEHSAIVTNARHYDSLRKASASLESAVSSLNKNMSGEFIATDLRMAESALSEIIGSVTSDDILNNIFAHFCIGK